MKEYPNGPYLLRWPQHLEMEDAVVSVLDGWATGLAKDFFRINMFVDSLIRDGCTLTSLVSVQAIPTAEIKILIFALEAWHTYGEGVPSATELRDMAVVKNWLANQER